MLSLKNHPFAVEAFFERSLVVTFTVPKEELGGSLPTCLKPDLFNEQWAFIALAVVSAKHLRPKGFPAILGHDFILTGYRVFVNYTNAKGKRLRGLYILKSETNKRKMTLLGNLFTHYNYSTVDISVKAAEGQITVNSAKAGIDLKLAAGPADVPLPAGSPFSNWKEARRFEGPLPFTFDYNTRTKEVLIIEGVRQNWTPTPLELLSHRVDFIAEKNFRGMVPANAFIVEQVPYHWKKGYTELWKG